MNKKASDIEPCANSRRLRNALTFSGVAWRGDYKAMTADTAKRRVNK
jgi:hypothetical protein